MPEAREGDRVIVLRDDEVVVARIVGANLVEQVRVLAQAGKCHLMLDAAFINSHQLLVEMVEGGTGRLQPVLEDGHITGVAVVLIALAHRVDGEGNEPLMFTGRQGSRTRELGVVDGIVREVPSGDDHVMTAPEETRGRSQALFLGHHIHLSCAVPAGP